MKNALKTWVAASLVAVTSAVGGSAYAASITFSSNEGNNAPKNWTLSCTACDMLAYFQSDPTVGSSAPYTLNGSLQAAGTAFFPTNQGSPGTQDPNLSGGAEEDFLTAVAVYLGDTVTADPWVKSDGSNANAAGAPTDAGDYLLWKASNYGGVAKILSIGAGNQFTFSGSHGLSHISHISTETSVVPLPAAGWMLLAGVGGLAALRRRKKA